MLIRITPDKQIQIEEPDNFKGFKVVSAYSKSAKDQISLALQGIGELLDDEHALINAQAFSQHLKRDQDSLWMSQFTSMIESAKKYGWINENPLRIKAHIQFSE
jgi:hypothetical protein